MLGAVFPGDKTVELRHFDDPTPGPDEVVLEMKASGICGSDLKQYRGTAKVTMPANSPAAIIPGHEPCGIVVGVGGLVPERVAKVGDRMMVHHYKGCGCCQDCFSGWTHLCVVDKLTYGLTAHGGHAQYLKVPASTLVRLPDNVSFEVGAAISCGSGTAWGALKRLDYSGRETLVVVGQGPVGLAATQFAVASGGRVIAIDVQDERLATARSFGAVATINSRSVDAQTAVRELTQGRGAAKVLDTTGVASGSLDAVRCAAMWGTVVMVGMGGTVTLDVSENLIRKQLTLRGSWTFSKSWQAECADYVSQHNLPVERLFTHRWSLEQADEAYRLFDTQTTGKAVILM